MIVATFSAPHLRSAMLAVNLATLCARNHRKTLLIDANSQKYALRQIKFLEKTGNLIREIIEI